MLVALFAEVTEVIFGVPLHIELVEWFDFVTYLTPFLLNQCKLP